MILFLKSFRECVGKGEAADLNEFLIRRGPDAEGFDAGAGGKAVCFGSAALCTRGGIVELDGEAGVVALPAQNVGAGCECDVADGDGGLNEEIVRVFAVGRVTGCDEDDSGDEFALGVNDA